jgi:hypothetical protein
MESTTALIKKANHLSEKHQELVARREQLLHCFSQAARAGEEKQIRRCYRRIVLTNEFLVTLTQIATEAAAREPVLAGNRFTVSSLFLHECFKELTADKNEQFIFITGSEVNGTYVLDQKITPEHERRTPGGVKADPRSTHRVLILLEKFKHRFLAHFHSHPGNGAGATHPSGIDEGFQKRLESAGHLAVAAIFSRDGYVRFFRLDRSFEIEIYGEGVEKHEENVYRLTHLD